MSNDRLPLAASAEGGAQALGHEPALVIGASCITCSDQALEARVLRVDAAIGMALVAIGDATDEVDVTLVGQLAPDDLVLIHGGVAIAKL
jgi:hypothetical protein